MKFSSVCKKDDYKTIKKQENVEANNAENLQQNDISSENQFENEKEKSSYKKKLKCKFCKKEFDFQSALEKHIRIHTGEKPFLCDYQGCNVSFAQVSNLIRHKRTHTGEKPFKCNLCQKTFTSTSNLKLHMKSHIDLPKDKLYCFIGLCERFYFSLETLKKHLQKSHKMQHDKLKEEYENKNFNQIYNLLKKKTERKGNLDFINFKEESSHNDVIDNNNNSPNKSPVDNNIYKSILQDQKARTSSEYQSEYEENDSRFKDLKNHESRKEKKDNNLKNQKEISNVTSKQNVKVCNNDDNTNNLNNHIKILFNNRNENINSDSNYFKSQNSSSKNNNDEFTFKTSNNTNSDINKITSIGCFNNNDLNSNKKLNNGIFKSTNFATKNQNMSANVPSNYTQSNQINFKVNSDSQKKFIFNSIPTYTQSSIQNLSANNLKFNNNNDNSNNNNFENNLLTNNTHSGTANKSNGKNDFLPIKINNELYVLDSQLNFSLNKYLENSINNILINLFSNGAQIDIKNQGIFEQPKINIIQKANENKTNFIPQFDFINNIKNIINNGQIDFSADHSNFGNIILNSLIEAYKQNNFQMDNKNNYLNQNALNNKFQDGVQKDINKPIKDQENIKKFSQITQEANNTIRMKKKRKINSISDSYPQSTKKSKFISINYKHKNKFNLPNPNYSYLISNHYSHNEDNKIPSQNSFTRNNSQNQNLNLCLNELGGENNKKNNNNNVYNATEDSYSSSGYHENPKIQKSGRIIKKNKFYNSKDFEINHLKKSIGRKRKNINSYNQMISSDNKDMNSNLNQSGNYSDNEYDKSSKLQLNPHLILNQNFLNSFKNQKEGLNNSVNIYEEMKFQRRLENETNYSNKQIEYENPYNLYKQTNNFDENMMKFPPINLGNLGAKYAFNPNEQSELTMDLYNQDFQFKNNIHSTKIQLIDKNDTNHSLFNYPIDYNGNNRKEKNDMNISSTYYDPVIISGEGSNISKRMNIKKTCCKVSKTFNELEDTFNFSDRENNDLNNTHFSHQSNRHSHSSCCKHRKRDKKSSNNQMNIKQLSKFANGNMIVINPIEKEINEEENVNIDQEYIELPANYPMSHKRNENKFKHNDTIINLKISDNSINENTSFSNNCNSAFKNLKINRNKIVFDNKVKDMNCSNKNFNFNKLPNLNMQNTITLNNNIITLSNSPLNNYSISNDDYSPSSRMSHSNNITSNKNIPNENSVNQNFSIEKDSKNNACCKSKKNIVDYENNQNKSFTTNNIDNHVNSNTRCCRLNSLKSNNSQNYSNNSNNFKENNKKESKVFIEETKDYKCKCAESSFQKRLPSIKKNGNLLYVDFNGLSIQEEKQKFNSCNIMTNNNNNNNNYSLLPSTSLVNPTSNSDNFKNNNFEGHTNNYDEKSNTNKNEEMQGNVIIPIFKKNSNNVKVFKPTRKNKEISESFEKLNGFLAPINDNMSAQCIKNDNVINNKNIFKENTINNFISHPNIYLENKYSENKKYPQLCSKNLYLDIHNVDSNSKKVAVKKIIREGSKFEENFLDKKCIEICGDLLICPELLPINCQKYLNRECDCVEKCQEKDSIYREFISSNKAIADLEF